MATLPDAWRCRVSAGTGWLGVSILWLGEMEGLVCSFYLSVAASSVRYTRMLLGCEASNQPTNKHHMLTFVTASHVHNSLMTTCLQKYHDLTCWHQHHEFICWNQHHHFICWHQAHDFIHWDSNDSTCLHRAHDFICWHQDHNFT